VRKAYSGLSELPPIDVYQIGEVYFVRDGNHRVSVAREVGVKKIRANVTVLPSKVSLSPDISPDDLILKAEYVTFLENTQLDQIRSDADLTLTVPGGYEELEEHIRVHRYFMGLEQQREIPYQEAAAHWYDEVYCPIVEVMHKQEVLKTFPDRTETDLYLWVSRHRSELQSRWGMDVEPESAAADLAATKSPQSGRFVTRLGEKILDALIPGELESGSPPGYWREEILSSRRWQDRIFGNLLVPISGEESGWSALEQAIVIAEKEGSRLYGIHVLPSEEDEHLESERIKTRFEKRCWEAGVFGSLTVVQGNVFDEVCERSRWVDLVIPNLAYPPSKKPFAKLGAGFHNLVRRCHSPILAVPGKTSPMQRALLAYDGSPKSEEALFIAAYLAGCWGISLNVITIAEKGVMADEVIEEARDYLNAHGVQAIYVQKEGDTGDLIFETVQEHDCDLIVMGGYGKAPMLEVVLGSTVDEVLRRVNHPVLICR
jgi:nucleotide-binding universal stress UspA family protein